MSWKADDWEDHQDFHCHECGNEFSVSFFVTEPATKIAQCRNCGLLGIAEATGERFQTVGAKKAHDESLAEWRRRYHSNGDESFIP